MCRYLFLCNVWPCEGFIVSPGTHHAIYDKAFYVLWNILEWSVMSKTRFSLFFPLSTWNGKKNDVIISNSLQSQNEVNTKKAQPPVLQAWRDSTTYELFCKAAWPSPGGPAMTHAWAIPNMDQSWTLGGDVTDGMFRWLDDHRTGLFT